MQQPHGGFPDRCEANDFGSINSEMSCPFVRPWIEEPNNRASFGIEGREVRTLMPIAIGTRQSKIVDAIVHDVLLRQDMLDMECQKRSSRLRKAAKFAPMIGPVAHECAAFGVHARSRLEETPRP